MFRSNFLNHVLARKIPQHVALTSFVDLYWLLYKLIYCLGSNNQEKNIGCFAIVIVPCYNVSLHVRHFFQFADMMIILFLNSICVAEEIGSQGIDDCRENSYPLSWPQFSQ